MHQQISDRMTKNEIFKRSRSMMRNLIKYGALAYKINLPKPHDSSFIDIELEYVDPLAWECVISKENSNTVIGYNVGDARARRNRQGGEC
jgi:hypothetical protein